MKKWVFCSSLKSCFSFSSHTITRVIFRMNEIHYLENVSLNFQQQNNNKKFLSDRFSFLPSLLSTCMKKVRQKKTFTDEMQKNNSLFCNAKLAYCDKPSIKFGFLSSIKSGVFLFFNFFAWQKNAGANFPPVTRTLHFLMLCSINWPYFIVWLLLLLEILGNMCIVIIYCPSCDLRNFEINLNFLNKPLFNITK